MTPDYSHIFWTRVKRGKKTECWEWQGTCNNSGYGSTWVGQKSATAHRVAAFLCGLVSTIAAPKSKQDKEHVLHKCDNRKCCNPRHFFFGSYSDNQLDAYKKKRRTQPKGENHANAKLTMHDAILIRYQYKCGFYQYEIAQRYKVSQRVISLIVRNETYIE